MTRYYCPKCKTFIELPDNDETEHVITWKNGLILWEKIHKIFKVIK